MTKTALLVMDVQKNIIDRIADADYLPRLVGAIDAARAADIPVMYVVIGFRPGHPEGNPANKSFGALPPGAFTPQDPGAAIHPDAAPRSDELVITKKRVSAFAGSDLRLLLRSAGIEHLILTGISTSGVVLSTLRQAADLDYQLTVLSDGCCDLDPEVHQVLIEKVFPRQADVITIDQWTKTLG
jgi:nicotinamidase-related amidase